MLGWVRFAPQRQRRVFVLRCGAVLAANAARPLKRAIGVKRIIELRAEIDRLSGEVERLSAQLEQRRAIAMPGRRSPVDMVLLSSVFPTPWPSTEKGRRKDR